MKIKSPLFKHGQAASGGNGIQRRRPQPMALEPRYMFDGAAVATAAEVVDATAHDVSVDAVTSDAAKMLQAPAAVQADAPAARHEIVFIDTSVPNWQTLAGAARNGVEVVLLDPARDAFDQMAEKLSTMHDVDAIHLISHGAEGELIIGGRTYQAASLSGHAAALATIGQSLSADGDVLLYGCDVGQGSSGDALISALALATHADVAASIDATGAAAPWSGNWVLEKQSGEITTQLFAPLASLQQFDGKLATVSMTGVSGWTAIMFGTGKDPQGDSQAGAADTDIVGDATHGSLYTAFDDNGTVSTADDTILFRMRIDNPTAITNFAGVAIVGMDANLDGRIDMFMSVDGRNNGQAVRLLDPGTGSNSSPSTTTTSALPTGWLSNNGVYAFTASNYAVAGVSILNDPHWTGDNDLGNAGGQDAFITWRMPIADLATVLAKASTVDRNGIYGPRGATGIAGYNANTVVQYVSFTQTQTGPINGDLNGVDGSYDRNATFASLGVYTSPMSASSPVPASTGLTITDNVAGVTNGNVTFTFQFTEGVSGFDASDVTVTGGTKGTFTAVDGDTYTLVVTPDAGNNNGTINVSVASGAATSIAGSLLTAAATGSQAFDTLAPTVGVDTPAAALSGRPTLTGTSNLADGSLITVTVDPDNVSGTANLIYQVMVSGGVWSLNTSTVTPTSGTMPVSGLTSYTKITATATDAAGNSTSAVELNRPTVTSLSTNSTTPTITGTWANIPGDTLTVTVGGATYTLAPAGNAWSLNLGTATPTSGSLTLAAGNTYSVTATVTRSAVPVSDTTSNELVITNSPVVLIGLNDSDISSGANTDGTSDGTINSSDPTPVLTGTSQNAGGFVIVRIDPNNDGVLSDAVTYSVTPDGGGNWVLDTGAATPISGVFPSAGFIGTSGIRVTDATGSISASKTLVVTTPTVAIGGIISAASTNAAATVNNAGAAANYLNMTEDNSVTISGTATGASTVDLTITDINSHVITISGVAVAGGNWTTSGNDLSSLDNGTLTVVATISGTAVAATNTAVTHDKTPPVIDITAQDPLKKTAAVITGKTDLADSTLLTVEIYDGATLKASWTNISVSGGAFTTNAIAETTGSANIGNGGPFTINVFPTSTTADTAGNITQMVTETRTGAPNASTNSIAIGAFAGGDGINTTPEITAGATISGTTTLTGTPTVNVVITDANGHTVNLSTAAASGAWSILLSPTDIKTLDNGVLVISATAVDTGVTLTDTIFSSLTVPSPTLVITDDTAGTATGDVTYTFTFSEDIIDSGSDAIKAFTVGDISVTNGTKGTFTKVNATTYTLVVTPTAASSGNIVVTVADSVAYSNSAGRGNVGDSDTQAFVTTGAAAAPTITIDASGLASSSTPVINGTTSLSAGAPIVIDIDTNNDGTVDLTYSATVQAGGTWSVNIATATPTYGTLTEAGLPTYAEVVATATNAYNNSTSATGLNNPVVTTLTTNDSTPTISGTWTRVTGDTLSVVVNGVTYSLANTNLTVGATTWSLTPTVALADNTYEVAATVMRGSGGSAADTSTNEVLVDTSAAVTISGGAATATTSDATPVIAGVSSSLPAGTVLTLSLDIDNNGSTDVVYKTTVAGDGSWSVDTATAIPFSGTFPAAGLNGVVLLTATATDPAGNTGTDTQILTVDVTPPAITLTFNSKTADTTPLISGVTDLPQGTTITVDIDPNNDGNWGDVQTYTTTVQAGGGWSVEATTVVSGTIGVRATGTDAAGNVTTTPVKTLQIVGTAPSIAVTSPIASVGVDNVADATEDDSVVLAGTTANVTVGSTVKVTITDGSITYTDTATVQAGGGWSLSGLNLSGLANGLITVTAEVIDTDGSAYNTSTNFTHDKSTVVAIDSISQDTGTLADFVTKDSTVSISGSGTANSPVTVLVKDSTTATVATFNVTSDANGAWSTAVTGVLATGSYTIEATVGATTATKALTIVDATAPTLTSSTPADNATGIAVGSNLTLTFSKNIQSGSGFISLYKNDGTLIENFNVATGIGDAGGTVTFNGTTGITLNPNSDLVAATAYYLNIGTSAVLDSVGNVYAGISNATTLNFTAAGGADTTAPTLASSDINDNDADNIVTAGDVLTYTVTFSEDMDASTVTAADFSNSGTAGVTIGTVLETSPGVFSVQVTTTSSGTLILQVPASAVLKDVAGNNLNTTSAIVDDTTVTVNVVPDTTAPTLASSDINDNDADNIVTAGDVLTYTVTFSEDMDASTVTAADFSNSGTAGVTIGTVLETSPGVFSVQVTTTSSGTLILQVPASAVLKDVAGNNLNTTSAIVDDTSVTVMPVQTATITAMTKDSGSSATDFLTKDGSANRTVSGTISAGLGVNEVVEVSFDGGSTWITATTIGTGWSISDSGVHGAGWTIAARVTNTVLALSGSVATQAVTLDTSVAAPTVALTTDSGSSGTDRVASSGALTVTGTEPGATIEYSSDGTTWSTTAPTPGEGANTVYVRQTDLAGNISSASTLTYTLDTIAPVIASAAINGATLTLTYTENGSGVSTASPGTGSFTVVKNGTTNLTVTGVAVDTINRTVTLTLSGPVLDSDTVTLTYVGGAGKTQDVAGNLAASFNAHAVTNSTAAIPITNAVTEPAPPSTATTTTTTTVTIDALAGDTPALTSGTQPNGLTSLNPLLNNDALAPITTTGLNAANPDAQRNAGNPVVNPSDALSGPGSSSSSDLSNIVTSRGENAFQITVVKANDPGLMRFRGIPDQSFTATGSLSVQIPIDAFVHTDAKAVVQLSARMVNGEPIPKWLEFDALTGKFRGDPPAGFSDELAIMVQARDSEGRTAEAMFRIKFSAKRSEGRSSLSEQFKLAGRHQDKLTRLQVDAKAIRKAA